MAQSGAPQGLWMRWKALKLPWRTKRLIGQDLSGTTFWELYNPLAPSRPRRIALPERGRQNLVSAADLKLSPAWLQWLRHTRPSAPTIQEQELELQRQAQLKQLAAAADARWEEKPRISDSPEATGQTDPSPLLPREDVQPSGRVRGQTAERAQLGSSMNVVDSPLDDQSPSAGDATRLPRDRQKEREPQPPWSKHRANPGDGWQPASWTSGKPEKR